MSKPRCYFASPMGFSDITRGWYADLLCESSEFVIPIDPFAYAAAHHVEGIRAAPTIELQRSRLNAMAKDLFGLIRTAKMMVAIIDGEPPDNGTTTEVGYAFALNDTGLMELPIIGYRNDSRAGGDGSLGFNAMLLPPMLETGGMEVRGTRADLVAAIGDVAARLG